MTDLLITIGLYACAATTGTLGVLFLVAAKHDDPRVVTAAQIAGANLLITAITATGAIT